MAFRETESRVVEIKFDNKEFEKNVQESLRTLDKLNESLEFKNGTKGLENIDSAAKKIDMRSLGKSVDEVSNKFSALEIMGITALANISNSVVNAGKNLLKNFIDPLVSGGLQRALNMEQANFMFEGLGFTKEQVGAVGKVGTIMDNIYKSVEGTIYSLDKASLVASRLMASGIEGFGKDSDLTKVLTGVAGIASVFSADYERVGDLFATIKAQGKLMGQQAMSFNTMGVPVYAKLAEYLNEITHSSKYTEAAITEMVSKGQIDFETFSNAMEWAFGDQASKSKQNFIGSLEDMKAAAARIGEKFWTPILHAGRDFYNDSVLLLDAINKKLNNPFSKFGNVFQSVVDKIIKGMDLVAAALDFEGTKEGLEALIDQGLAAEDRLDNLKDHLETINKIKAVFEVLGTIGSRIISVFKVIITTIISIIKHLEPLGSAFWKVGEGIVSFASKVDEVAKASATYIQSLSNAIKESKLFEAILDKIKIGLVAFKDFFVSFGNSIVDITIKIGEIGKNLVNSAFDILETLASRLKAIFDLTDVFQTGIVSLLVLKLGQLYTLFTKAGSASGSFLGILRDFNLGLVADLKKTFSFLADAMYQFGVTMQVYQRSLNADIMLKIALAIGVLAVSLKLLSGIEPERLLMATGAIAALAKILQMALGGLSTLIMKISGLKWKNIAALATMSDAMVKIALSLLIMAKAVQALGKLKLEDAIKGLGSLYLISLILIKTLKEFSKIGKFKVGILSLTAITTSITTLAIAFALLGKMSWGEIARGFTSLLGVATILILVVKALSKVKAFETGMGKLFAIAISLDLLAIAFSRLGKMSWGKVGRGFTALLGVATIMLLVVKALSKVGAFKTGMGKLLIISASLDLLAIAFSKIGSMSWPEIGRGFTGLLGVAVIMTEVLKQFAKISAMGGSIASFLVIAVSFGILANTLNKIGGMSWGSIAKGLLSLSTIAVMMVAAINSLSQISDPGKLLGISAALLAMSLAMGAMSITIGLIGSLPLGTIIKGLIGLAGALLLLSGLSKVLEPTMTSMLKLAGTIAAFGAASIIVGAGLLIIGVGLSTMADGVAKVGGGTLAMLTLIVVTLTALAAPIKIVGQSFIWLGAGISVVGLGLTLLGVGITAIGLGFKLLSGSAKAMVESMNAFAEVNGTAVAIIAGLVVLFGILSPLAAALGISLLAVGAGLMAVGEGIILIDTGVAGIAKAFQLVQKVIDGIFKGIEKRITGMVDTVGSKLSTMKKTIETYAKTLKTLLDTMKTTLKGINDLYDEAKKAGAHVVDGLIKGINENKSKAINAANALARETLQAYKDAMGIESPSKEMIKLAFYTIAGYVKGIKKNTTTAENSMKTFANAVMVAYESASDELSANPVIVPIVDMSNVDKAAGKINKSFGYASIGSVSATNLAASISVDGSNNSKMLKTLGKIENALYGVQPSTVNNYNVNGITYDDGSNVANAVGELVRVARVEGRS